MGLTRDEVKHLLALVAVLDERDTDDPLLLSAWCAMAEEGQWESFAAAKRALMVHRTEQPNYPMRPGHISQVLERVRRQASAAYTPPDDQDIPRAALEDPLEYQRFMRSCVASHHARWMASFERGDRPERAQTPLEAARLPSQRALPSESDATDAEAAS